MAERHEQEKPWTTKQLAKEAGMNPSRIRQLLLAGLLDGYKAGRDWLIPDDVARAWLEDRQKRRH